MIPDDSSQNDVMALAAYSGVNGARIWSTELGLPRDHWCTDVPWPLTRLCGAEAQRRIVVLGMDNNGAFSVNMLATSNGESLSQLPLPNKGTVRARDVIGNLPGAFEMSTSDAHSDWPTILLKYCDGVLVTGTWFNVQTSPDALVEAKNISTNGYELVSFFADIDGDGVRNRLELSKGILTCFDNNGAILWKREGTPLQSWQRTFESASQPPMALLLDDNQRDVLVDLRDGRTLWSRGTRLEELRDQNLQLLNTPLVNGNLLVSVTREDVTWTQLESDRIEPPTNPFQLAAVDLRTKRQLPTSPLLSGQSASKIAAGLVESLVLAVFGVCLPIAYVYRLLRRQHTLSFLMMAPVVAIPAILVWRYVLEPTDLVSAMGGKQAVAGGTMLVLAAAVLFQVVRQRHWLIAALIGLITSGLTVLMICAPILVDRLSGNTAGYQWGWPEF